MSGLIGPSLAEVALGLSLEIALKSTVPLAAGLVASVLPGSASSRHLRLSLSLLALPPLAAATALARGAEAALVSAPPSALVAWGCGSALVLVRLALALREIRMLPSVALPSGLERSTAVRSPLTVGFLRPRILVPADFDAWPLAAQAAALAHERAHVRRGDWLVQMLVWALSALLWFHPLVALARRRLALLAECAADDAVVAAGHDPVAYAELILGLGQRQPQAALALGRSPVGVRVRRLLGRHPRGGASVWSLLLTIAALALGSASIAGRGAWQARAPVAGCTPAGQLLPVQNTVRPPWRAP